jgi:hypothetical protein
LGQQLTDETFGQRIVISANQPAQVSNRRFVAAEEKCRFLAVKSPIEKFVHGLAKGFA